MAGQEKGEGTEGGKTIIRTPKRYFRETNGFGWIGYWKGGQLIRSGFTRAEVDKAVGEDKDEEKSEVRGQKPGVK